MFINGLTILGDNRVIQGSGLSGPIPSSISALEKLTDLLVAFTCKLFVFLYTQSFGLSLLKILIF